MFLVSKWYLWSTDIILDILSTMIPIIIQQLNITIYIKAPLYKKCFHSKTNSYNIGPMMDYYNFDYTIYTTFMKSKIHDLWILVIDDISTANVRTNYNWSSRDVYMKETERTATIFCTHIFLSMSFHFLKKKSASFIFQ